jgi:hypothetical protein
MAERALCPKPCREAPAAAWLAQGGPLGSQDPVTGEVLPLSVECGGRVAPQELGIATLPIPGTKTLSHALDNIESTKVPADEAPRPLAPSALGPLPPAFATDRGAWPPVGTSTRYSCGAGGLRQAVLGP